MTQSKLNAEQDFLVRESAALNYIVGLILLSDKQDKAEEEIIEAINFYNKASRHPHIVSGLSKKASAENNCG